MKKLYMLDAEIDYSGCYYESDTPELQAELKEVSLMEAIKAMHKEQGYLSQEILAIMEEDKKIWEKYTKAMQPKPKKISKKSGKAVDTEKGNLDE